ncbi:MAG: hypothetical protein V4550_13265 [Gemmatimonadota bacterium]
MFTGTELLEHYQRLRRDPAFDPDLCQIGDLRGVERFDVENREIEITAELPVFASASRRALVVSQPVQFGLARMFASYAELAGQQVRVFRDYAEAEAWVSRSGARD